MFLKELEIYGFKSFAKKTKIAFNPGITAIVGPNGCGKSNLIDAVRWVLGEQNIKSMRGNQLTDIIFSGNHQERPSNMAEVSLLLNNSSKILPFDWEEISIKRRIYRSGETENFINGIPCRLKDIQELFMDTGLGKNSYSIIAQGEVDLVLSAKPSDRRYLFEEAASISKYKYEKQKTIKTITEIDFNLNQIFSLLSEVKNQLDSFKEEADNLRKYKLAQQEIKELELYLIHQKYYSCHVRLLKIKKGIERLRENQEKISLDIKKREEVISTLKQELIELSKKRERYISESYEWENKKNRIQQEFNLISQKRQDLEKRLISLQKDSENLSQKIALFQKDQEELNLSRTKIGQEIDESYKKLDNLKRKADQKMKFLNSISSIRKSFEEMSQGLHKKELFLREQEIKFHTTLNLLESNLDKIKKNKALLEEKIKVMSEKERGYREALKEDKKNGEENSRKKVEERIKEVEGILTKLRWSWEKDAQEVKLKEEKKDLLIQSTKNFSLKEDSHTSFISQYQQKYPEGICRKLIQLIDYVPPEYEKVIEIALGEALNSLVVDDIHATLNLINSLAPDKIGEIKIVPLDLVESSKNICSGDDMKINSNNPDYIYGFAHQLVNYKEEYKKLFQILLGNVLVVENLEVALNLYNKCLGTYKIVTLDEGAVIGLEGMINFGGGVRGKKKEENIFYLEREITRLDKDIKNLKTKIKDEELSLKEYTKIYSSLLEEDKTLKNTLQEEERKAKETLDNLNRTLTSLNEFKNSWHNLTGEEENLLREKRLISKKQYIFRQINNEVNNYNRNTNDSKELIDNLLKQKNELINNIGKQINALENHILVSKQKQYNFQDKEKSITSYIKEGFSELEVKRRAIEEDKNDLEGLKKTAERYRTELEELKHRQHLFIDQREELKRSIEEKTKQMEDLIQEKDKQLKILEQKRNNQHREEISVAQYQEKCEYIEDEVLRNYQIPLKDLELYQNKSSSPAEASQKIETLKKEILKLGQINFEAENRYQNQLSRYHLLEEKYNELSQAKKLLEKISRELEEIAKKKFIEIFDQARIHFREIFSKLFTGGEADLSLDSPEDILNSGIEIIAHPPGKEARSIELLSSGERALTAMALLIALWKVNPSPFCFFDEIDTALDEVNAERLSTWLKKEELGKSQLIIITHQKSTIEAADSLYGVTMEDSGISKVVSVKLN